jgi:hypothetical protein
MEQKSMAKKKKPSVQAGLIVTSAKAADFFDTSQSNLRNWKVRGCPGSLGHNMWDLKILNQWFMDNILESRLDTSDPELATSKRLYWHSKARREQLRADEEERSLISVPEVLEIYGTLMARFKNGLIDFSTRLPPVISGKSQSQMIGIIKNECCLLLSGFTGSKKYGEHEVPKEYLALFGPTWDAQRKKKEKK